MPVTPGRPRAAWVRDLISNLFCLCRGSKTLSIPLECTKCEVACWDAGNDING